MAKHWDENSSGKIWMVKTDRPQLPVNKQATSLHLQMVVMIPCEKKDFDSNLLEILVTVH